MARITRTVRKNNSELEKYIITGPTEREKIEDLSDLDALIIKGDDGSNIRLETVRTIISVEKPDKGEFVRVTPDVSLHISLGLIELKKENQLYLVHQKVRDLVRSDPSYRVMKLVPTISFDGKFFLWPLRMPNMEGNIDQWSASAIEAAKLAMSCWVRVSANISIGAYETKKAVNLEKEPEWPNLSLEEIINTAFRDRIIMTLDHPVLKKLRGEEF